MFFNRQPWGCLFYYTPLHGKLWIEQKEHRCSKEVITSSGTENVSKKIKKQEQAVVFELSG